MNRRTMMRWTIATALTPALQRIANASGKTHFLTLSFDDGFKKSFYKTADIYEEFGLHACLNVIASGHFPGFPKIDAYMDPKLFGNFDDWNKLKARGHEIMPHTWDHRDLTKVTLPEAEVLMDRCFEYFEQHLEGFKTKEAVFNFAYNFSNAGLDELALKKCRAVRTQGDTPINSIPTSSKPIRLGCFSNGPNVDDPFIEEQVKHFLNTPGGWLILNVHGLDDEGWGPTSSRYLRELLRRMLHIPYLEMIPTGMLLRKIDDSLSSSPKTARTWLGGQGRL